MRLLTSFFVLLLSASSHAQIWVPTPVASMPMAISNNAVCEARVNGDDFMYSFCGIDSSKKYSGIHLKTFKYDVGADAWSLLSDVPDTLGKIAASASYIKGKIYLIGGYYVYSDGSEKSSNLVHVFDPQTDSFLPNAAPIPIPIDDQVQCVWRDSLIFVISGWSNTGNVSDVQIFNPSNNSWQAGTSVPNSAYHAFGSNGVIKNDTIYYYGGASGGFNFPASAILRKGVIDTNNPANITWLPFQINTSKALYRSITLANPVGSISFLGGSNISYNYNGISYANNQGVNPANEQLIYDVFNQNFNTDTMYNFPMDLRGYANVGPTIKYISGGMEANQIVSNKAYKLEFANRVGVSDWARGVGLEIYPNPSKGMLNIRLDNYHIPIFYDIKDMVGRPLASGKLMSGLSSINIENVSKGQYFIVLSQGNNKTVSQFVIN